MSYNESDIWALVASLGHGNPGRDADARALLRRISERPEQSGLSAELIERIRLALAPQ